MGFRNSILGGINLIRAAIQSPNFVAGTSGWTIKQDGSAEFNNIVIRGGTIVSGTALYYSPSPGAGNLILSIAAAGGTDAYGNTYPRGLSVGSDVTRQIVLDYTGTDSRISFSANNGHSAGSGVLVEAVLAPGAANEHLSLQALGPAVNGFTNTVSLALSSQNLDGSSNANITLAHSVAGSLATFDNVAFTSLVAAALQQGVTVTGLSALVERANATDTAIRARVTGDVSSRLLFTADGVATTYANNAFNTYVPAVGNIGTATFTTQTGFWQRLGKMIYVCVYLQVNAAGSGAGIVTVDMPTAVYRGTRQTLHMSTESVGPGGSHIGTGQCLFFTGGAGATADRLRTSDNGAANADNNITGADLLAGGLITIEGWYREA